MTIKINKKLILENDDSILGIIGNTGSHLLGQAQEGWQNTAKSIQAIPGNIKASYNDAVSDSLNKAQIAAHKAHINSDGFKAQDALHQNYGKHLLNQHNQHGAQLDNVNAGYTQALQNQHAGHGAQLDNVNAGYAQALQNQHADHLKALEATKQQALNAAPDHVTAEHAKQLQNMYDNSIEGKFNAAKDEAYKHVSDNRDAYAAGGLAAGGLALGRGLFRRR